MTITQADLAQKIDHTLLKPTLALKELEQLCREAAHYHFKTVCIPPTWVKDSIRLLQGAPVEVITVIGFPLGYSSTEAKLLEAKQAIAEGAREIDMVINISYLKNNRLPEVQDEIARIVKICDTVPLKVIIETAYLDSTEKIAVAKAAEAAGAAFVKTSTGFATGVPVSGATLEDIRLLRQNLKPATKIKASGGIRDFASAVAFVQAGADRLGTSAGVHILEGLVNESGY